MKQSYPNVRGALTFHLLSVKYILPSEMSRVYATDSTSLSEIAESLLFYSSGPLVSESHLTQETLGGL